MAEAQGKQGQSEGEGEKPQGPFAAGLELFSLSPHGLVRCAHDWLLSSFEEGDIERGIDADSPGFAAAGRALEAYPKVFVGAGEVSWSDTPLEAFWRMAFRSRARGESLADFKSILGALGKADLAKGARLMMIAAAKERDAASFKELLGMGAARRSKLVLFSAYENGGKKVAEAVKQPTALEAVELIKKGGEAGYRWRGSEVRHDWEGFDWLMGKAGGSIEASILARVAANASERGLALKAIGKYKATLSEATQYNHQTRRSEVPERECQIAWAAFGLAGAGCPEAAKALCESHQAEALWAKLCASGQPGGGSFAVRALVGGRGGMANFTPAAGRRAPMAMQMTMQAACALSRDEEAVKWLRGEYEAAGARWLGGAELAAVYAQFNDPYGAAKAVEELSGAAAALSEAVDMRAGLEAAKGPKAPPAKRRAL